jgi:hypothetical protein
MTRSYGGEGRSSAYARQLVSKLKARGKAIKRENINGRYSHVSWLFRFGIGYSQAKMAPDTLMLSICLSLHLSHYIYTLPSLPRK